MSKLSSLNKKRTLLTMIVIFVLLAFIVSSLNIYTLARENQIKLNQLDETERRLLDSESKMLSYRINNAIGDLLFLAANYDVQLVEGQQKDDIAKAWQKFADNKRIYDQIRFIDQNGNEKIRVDYAQVGSDIAPDSQLQNKKDRYYFTETAKLEKGQIYLSKFDLNVENNQIEKPDNPMIRLATPLYDQNGAFQGIVILNYFGKELIALLDDLSATSAGNRFLLNSDGYWLYNNLDHSLEWSFMYADKKAISFKNQFTAEWDALQTIESTEFKTENGYFINKKLTLIRDETPGNNLKKATIVHGEGDWTLVSFIPSQGKLGYLINLSFIQYFDEIVFRQWGVFVILLLVSLALAVLYQINQQAKVLLKKERELFNTTLMSVGEGIVMAKCPGEILLFNSAAERITGYSQDKVLHRDLDDVFHLVDVQTGASAHERIMDLLRNGQSFENVTDFALMTKDGAEKRILVNIARIKAGDREEDRILASFRDINKEYELEKQIEGFLNVNIDMLCVADTDGRFHQVNRKFEEVLGYRTNELEGELFLDFVHPDDMKSTLSALSDLINQKTVQGFTNRYRCKDGTYKYIEWFSQPGIGKYTYSSARDVTQKHFQEEQLRQAAIKDELTGLYNRHYFESIIEEQMQHADRYDEPLSMLLLDLDLFKQVNDTWGHPVGDELLKLTATTVSKTIRESDILIRFGGEEFAVLMPRTSLDGALLVAEKIRAAVANKPLATVGIRTVSIGAAERMKAESFRHWYRRLDGALYEAKQTGRNRVVASDGNEKLPIRAFDLEWRFDLQSGNDEIDRQHLELFEIGNRFISSSLEGTDEAEIMKQLDSLLSLLNSHFACEEKILEQAGYPDTKYLRESHKDLSAKASRLKGAFERGEIKASAYFSYIVDEMILNHLKQEDKKFFPFLKKI